MYSLNDINKTQNNEIIEDDDIKVTLLNSLNTMQKTIVVDTQGAKLVTAGAGSGKTRILTNRICYMIRHDKISPNNILAITFTNKATKEMQERIEKMVPDHIGVTIKTFHSFCASILRENISKLDGFDRYFSVYDDKAQKDLLKKVIKDLGIDEEIGKKCDYHISNAKNQGLMPTEYLRDNRYEPNIEDIVRVYREYQEQLKINNALDFDDLLLKTLELFEKCPQVLEYYQEKFKYIHVDEFQDTNLVQYKILKLLGEKYKNVFVVGDEDQCIYCWRGANIGNINEFIHDFNPKIYKLEQNYRSTKNIIKRANTLIKNNTARIDKTLFTENEEGEEVTYHEGDDEKDEAEYIARMIYTLKSRGVALNEIGILMRLTSLSGNIEQKLLNYNLPYKTSGIMKFFERMEVKNVLAYLSIVVNPKDNEKVTRIINYPKRGIGQATIDKLQAISRETRRPLTDLIENFRDLDITSTIKNKIEPFSNLLIDLKNAYAEKTLYDFAEYAVDRAEIRDIYNTNSEEDIDRKANINQLMQFIKDYEYLNDDANLADYLESVTLQSDISQEDDDEESVSISTIHASKGLEFDYVFLVGLEEGKFPLSRALDSADEMEEERRLMYVGITRARKKLYITRAKSRYLYGERKESMPSRFIEEMGISVPKRRMWQENSYYDNDNNYGSYGYNNGYSGYNSNRYSKSSESGYSRSDYFFENSYTEKKREFGNTSGGNTLNNLQNLQNSKLNSQKKNFDDYKVGVQVLHTKFGVGTIIKVDNASGNNFVSVDFGKMGVKTLSLNFAPLQILKK